MQEVIIINRLGLKVFINGVPDLSQIPKEVADCFISAIEIKISESVKLKTKKS